MLAGHILPMPSLEPQRYVDLYLSNPLLLAAHPDRMRHTAEAWAAGGYDQAATAALAGKLSALRQHIVLNTAVEPSQPEAERELLDLAAHPRIDKAERTRLQKEVMGSRPSEYAWLKGILEAAILDLAEARDERALQAEAAPAARRQVLRDTAATITRTLGVAVRPASELAA
jgi:hypothetical protein